MKQYLLTKTEIFGMPVKKINYSFEVEEPKPMKKVTSIIIHHTGNSNTIQKIINNHVKKKHYTSIGYHIIIGKNGQIYYSRDISKIGAHTYSYNTKSIGIALFGNFNKNEPSNKQIETLNKVLDILTKELNIKKVIGHNQAIYDLLKGSKKLTLPEIEPISITNDIEYYSFLKKIDIEVQQSKDEELLNIFNRLKTCPGINFYKSLQEIEKKFNLSS